MTSKKLFIRVVVLPLLIVTAWAQQLPRPEPSRKTRRMGNQWPRTTPEGSALNNLQNALDEQNTAQPEVAADPNKPRTHRFTNQPVGTVLRALAEEAQISYIEPAINPEERISLTLPSMTPIQAFYAVAEARGFRVRTSRNTDVLTLSRSDISAPSYYVSPGL